MQDSDSPLKFTAIWAHGADPAFITYPVNPTPTLINGEASFQLGFPEATFTPISAGGAAPFGEDYNGILKQLTACVQWLQAGGPSIFDSAFSTAIGGYPKGALLQSSGNPHIFFVSTADNNTNNPDVTPTNWDTFNLGTKGFIVVDATPGTRNLTWPAGYTSGLGFVTGAGGGGAGTNSGGFTGGAGGAGGTGIFFTQQVPGTVISYTVGTGGIAGVAGGSPTDGGNGGSSSFGSIASATGGSKGSCLANAAGGQGGQGVISIGAGVPMYGGQGGDGEPYSSNIKAGDGGASFWGGGSRGSTTGSFITAAPGSGGGGGYGGGGGSPGINGLLVILGLG